MVNASWTARPRSPLSTREFWQRSPPTLPNPNPVGTPGGVSGIWPTSRHGTRFVSPEFRGGGSGLGSPGCRALRHTMPLRDSAEPLVRFSRAALPSADSPRASLRGSDAHRFTGSSLDRASVSTVALQFPNFGADVRVQVCHLALVNPIERDAVSGQLECLLAVDEKPGSLAGLFSRAVQRCSGLAGHPSGSRDRHVSDLLVAAGKPTLPRSVGS